MRFTLLPLVCASALVCVLRADRHWPEDGLNFTCNGTCNDETFYISPTEQGTERFTLHCNGANSCNQLTIIFDDGFANPVVFDCDNKACRNMTIEMYGDARVWDIDQIECLDDESEIAETCFAMVKYDMHIL